VTVAVIDPLEIKAVQFNDRDFKIDWYSGTGKGGQNRNKVQACCRLTHLPSGLIQTAQTRSRESSFKLAKDQILTLLNRVQQNSHKAEQNTNAAAQHGSGMRGDKRRTYRFQDDRVQDHLTGKSATISKVLEGNFNLLW
jgi:peptide chain release factor 1